MKFSLLTCVLLAASSASFCQEAGKERPKDKDGEILVDQITAVNSLSYEDAAKKTIAEFTKPSITLCRYDKKGGKVKGATFTGDSGTSESQPGGGVIRKLTLKGNVRTENQDGCVISADEVVVDLVEGLCTYTGKVGVGVTIVITEK
jgi:hypothetical protein